MSETQWNHTAAGSFAAASSAGTAAAFGGGRCCILGRDTIILFLMRFFFLRQPVYLFSQWSTPQCSNCIIYLSNCTFCNCHPLTLWRLANLPWPSNISFPTQCCNSLFWIGVYLQCMIIWKWSQKTRLRNPMANSLWIDSSKSPNCAMQIRSANLQDMFLNFHWTFQMNTLRTSIGATSGISPLGLRPQNQHLIFCRFSNQNHRGHKRHFAAHRKH